MILDSNIFIRYLTQTIPAQFEETKEIFIKIEQGLLTGMVSILVIDEILWALENYYEFKRQDYVPKIIKIFHLNNIKIIEVKKDLILSCLDKVKNTRFDFTDIYLASIAKKDQIISFDKDFQKLLRK